MVWPAEIWEPNASRKEKAKSEGCLTQILLLHFRKKEGAFAITHMKTLLRNIKIIFVFFILLSVFFLGGLSIQLYRSQTRLAVAAGENKEALKARYANAGNILSADGQLLAYSEDGQRFYHQSPQTAAAMLHLVGDYTHHIDQTIESRYQRALTGTQRHFFHQLLLDVQGLGLQGDTLTLTADAELSQYASELLTGSHGAIVMINYQTGAVLIAVSQPSASPESVISWEGFADGSLFNRAFKGQYVPGSVFKIMTAAAWLQSEHTDTSFEQTCSGESTVGPDGASETGDGHGRVNLESAFSLSCNIYFGAAGVQAGADALRQTAAEAHFNQQITAGAIELPSGRISLPDDPEPLSWAAIGQPSAQGIITMTPLHMAMLAGSIAHEGTAMKPQLILYRTDPSGHQFDFLKPEKQAQFLPAAVAASLDSLMQEAVRSGTGRAALVPGLVTAGKTGTVQLDQQANNALFAGYIKDERLPLAIAVVVEQGGSGAQTAAPIAGALFSAAAEKYIEE